MSNLIEFPRCRCTPRYLILSHRATGLPHRCTELTSPALFFPMIVQCDFSALNSSDNILAISDRQNVSSRSLKTPSNKQAYICMRVACYVVINKRSAPCSALPRHCRTMKQRERRVAPLYKYLIIGVLGSDSCHRHVHSVLLDTRL